MSTKKRNLLKNEKSRYIRTCLLYKQPAALFGDYKGDRQHNNVLGWRGLGVAIYYYCTGLSCVVCLCSTTPPYPVHTVFRETTIERNNTPTPHRSAAPQKRSGSAIFFLKFFRFVPLRCLMKS